MGHFRLRYPKNYDKSKVYPIEFEYIFSGKSIRRSMNIFVSVDDWNPKGNNGRGEIRASVPDSISFNRVLISKLKKVDTVLNEYNQQFPCQVNEEVIASFLDDKLITRKAKGRIL